MLRDYIKSEFYKFFRSKGILILLLFIFLCRIYTLKNYFVDLTNKSSLFMFYQTSGGSWVVMFCALGVLIGARDYSTGYIKNLYAGSNKFYYAFAKFVLISTLALACVLIDFILMTAFILIFGKGVICLKSEIGLMLFLCILMPWILWTAVLSWWAGISSILKNGIIPLIISIGWNMLLLEQIITSTYVKMQNLYGRDIAHKFRNVYCRLLILGQMLSNFSSYQLGFKWNEITIWIIAMVVYIIGGFGMIWAGAKLRRKK